LNWDAIGAIAELLGAIGVIATLAYLAVQVRQNTSSLKSSTELESGRLWSELHSRMAHSPDMASIWDKGLTDDTLLSPGEKQKFIWFVAEYFFLVESLFKQKKLACLSEESWEGHELTVLGMLQNPLVKRWFDSGVSPYSAEFVNYLNQRMAAGGKQTWEYSPLSEL
jgi:hypothetical protein